MKNDLDFARILLDRISRYADLESSMTAKVAEFQGILDDARKRRKSAEALYRTEFGELPDEPYPEGDRHAKAVATVSEDRPEYRRADVGPLFTLSWGEALLSVLGAAGRPLHVSEIWSRMKEGGFTTTALDPHRSIVAVALRTPHVVRAAPNTYGLIDPEGGGA